MAGASRLGVNKTSQRPITKRVAKRRGLSLEGVVNYLKSDSFLYSHLISSPSPSSSFDSLPAEVTLPLSPQEKAKIGSGNKMKASEELGEYMKSDSYLYSPLELVVVATHPPSAPPKDTGNPVQLKKVSKEVGYTRISTHKTRGTPKVVAVANGYNLRRP